MNLLELYFIWRSEEEIRKQIQSALDSTLTEDLTRMWDDWDGVSNMFQGQAPVSELDVYCELRKRGINRVYC